jgi:NAD(P) transhydrogenase subunit alpha
MSIKVAILKETRPLERRVALVPAVVDQLIKLGVELHLESGAGDQSKVPDALFKGVSFSPSWQEAVSNADVLLAVQPPGPEVVHALKEGAVLISFIYADKELILVKLLQERKITCFAMELVPRISRAQPMDALSSQAALAGYYAALLGATTLARIVPMMTTAVGALRPARILVMGLGVAGLQALATMRRLGALLEAYDVRLETKEEAQSLGAKFVDVGLDATSEGGYARELTSAENEKVREVLTRHIQQADVVITTAAVPGRPSPKLISKKQVEGMKAGSVIVDLAGEGGGNCEYSRPGQTVQVGYVTILAPLNLPSLLGEHASQLYAKNVCNLLRLMVKDKALQLDWEDEILAKSALTHAGEIKNEAARRLLAASMSGAASLSDMAGNASEGVKQRAEVA